MDLKKLAISLMGIIIYKSFVAAILAWGGGGVV
jgi:hypothetical protein